MQTVVLIELLVGLITVQVNVEKLTCLCCLKSGLFLVLMLVPICCVETHVLYLQSLMLLCVFLSLLLFLFIINLIKHDFIFPGIRLLCYGAYYSCSYDSLLGGTPILVGNITVHYCILSCIWKLVIAQYSFPLLHGCSHTTWTPS